MPSAAVHRASSWFSSCAFSTCNPPRPEGCQANLCVPQNTKVHRKQQFYTEWIRDKRSLTWLSFLFRDAREVGRLQAIARRLLQNSVKRLVSTSRENWLLKMLESFQDVDGEHPRLQVQGFNEKSTTISGERLDLETDRCPVCRKGVTQTSPKQTQTHTHTPKVATGGTT